MTNAPAQPVQGVEAAVAIIAKARDAYINVIRNRSPDGDTSADRHHSEDEISASAGEAMFEEFGALTFEQVNALLAALPREAPAAVAWQVRPLGDKVWHFTDDPRPTMGYEKRPLFASPAPAPEAPAGWQDISTAPKDSTDMLAGFWNGFGKWCCAIASQGPNGLWFDWPWLPKPTHWQPIVAPALATQADDTKGEA